MDAIDRVRQALAMREAGYRAEPKAPDVDVLLHTYDSVCGARPISEYHEDMGTVLWWKFPIDEPPYCGSPLDLGYTVEAEMIMRRHGETEIRKVMREQVGGWPGYHTHWTPIVSPKPLRGGQ